MLERLVLMSALALLICGCSGKPSDSLIQSLLSPPGTDKLYEIAHLKKTNGLQKDDHTYVASVHYEVTFKKGIEEFMNSNGTSPAGIAPKDGTIVGYVMGRALASSVGGPTLGEVAKDGNHVAVDDDVTLVKTDNGWQLQ
jgi:hypothetical protein